MKARVDRSVLIWLFIFLASFWPASPAGAQTASSLDLELHAGVMITGTVGTLYAIQATSDLGQTEGWEAIGIILLPASPHLWVDTTAPAAGRRFYRAVAGPTNLAWVSPGIFTMGSPNDEPEREDREGPRTVVKLTEGFYMGKFEVSQGEYQAVMSSNPSMFRNGTSPLVGGSADVVTNELSHPVERVSYHDATGYCAMRTDQERASGQLPVGWRYRLPTEAEWEYACRSGTTTAFETGPAFDAELGNFLGFFPYDSEAGTFEDPVGVWLGRTVEGGSYQPNGFGLFDMHGNVWEWCLDAWAEALPGGRVTDPRAPEIGIVRGGSWGDSARACRSAAKVLDTPGDRSSFIGFRVVLVKED